MGRGIVFTLLFIVIAAGGGFWYVVYSGGDVPAALKTFLPKKSGPVQAPGSASASASLTAAERIRIASERIRIFEQMYEAKLPQWRNALRSKCDASDPDVHPARFDVDGDGHADRVCWDVLHSDEMGTDVEVLAEAARPEGKYQTAYTAIPADWKEEELSPSGGQNLLCNSHLAKVGPYRWKASDNHLFELDDHKPSAVVVATGDCPPAYLFWPKDHVTPNVDFDVESDSQS